MRTPLNEVLDFWNRLPAYRAVAESEHLPSAADRLHVSASAVSRNLSLLEEQLERPLFHRIGRRIVLNSDGELLLDAVRDAMRRVHDAVEHIGRRRFAGPLRISSMWIATRGVILPALEILSEAHPALVPELDNRPVAALSEALMGGVLDVAFVTAAMHGNGLECTALGKLGHGIYCGRGHRFFGVEDVTVQDLEHELFAAPPPDSLGRVRDGWSIKLDRRIGMHIHHMHIGMEVCATGRYLCVLPDIAVATDPLPERFWRLPMNPVPDATLYALRRRPLSGEDRVSVLLDAVKTRMAELLPPVE